ncbi:MAG: hypothetical protein ABI193_10765 [Minicystis sp.]
MIALVCVSSALLVLATLIVRWSLPDAGRAAQVSASSGVSPVLSAPPADPCPVSSSVRFPTPAERVRCPRSR